MKRALHLIAALTLVLSASCGGSDENTSTKPAATGTTKTPYEASDDHEHDETSLGAVKIGAVDVELAQGHGLVVAGKESHLVVKLPYTDRGATVVRAWIGSQDRTLSYVGKGEYAASHDDYDVHATAPTPLPADAMWWIEIERPDGSKALGSARALLE